MIGRSGFKTEKNIYVGDNIFVFTMSKGAKRKWEKVSGIVYL